MFATMVCTDHESPDFSNPPTRMLYFSTNVRRGNKDRGQSKTSPGLLVGGATQLPLESGAIFRLE